MKQVIKRLFQRAGYELVNVREPNENNLERERYSSADVAIYSQVREYTMVGPVGTLALVQAVEYLLRNRIPGAFVECGVWRGGQMMAVALTLLRLEERNRDLFLFDTFEGMPEPQEAVDGKEACEQWRSFRRKTNGRWCAISREEVRENLYRVGYPETRIHLVKGKVEENDSRPRPGADCAPAPRYRLLQQHNA